MSAPDLERLQALARKARWAFPTSYGSPVPPAAREAWVDELLAEQDAFAETARVLVERGEEEAATELAANVWRLWVLSGDAAGGRRFLGTVLNAGDGRPSRERALALYGDGLLAHRLGALDESRQRNEAALEAAQATGDPEALALAHLGLSRAEFDQGDFERSGELAERAREHAAALEPVFGQAPLHMHAQSRRMAGDYDRAAELFAESLELNRRVGDLGMVPVELHNLGHVEIQRGNVDTAEALFAECAAMGSPDDPYDAAMARMNGAAVALGRGDRDWARALLAEFDSLLDESELAGDDRLELNRLREQTRE